MRRAASLCCPGVVPTTSGQVPPRAPLVALALGHLFVAAAWLALACLLVFIGTRPNAELEGVYAMFGVLLAVPGAAFAIGSVACSVALVDHPRRAARLSLALGSVEVLAAALLAWGVVVAVASYDEFAPWRSPLIVPGLLLAGIGIPAIVCANSDLRAKAG